MNRRSTSEQLFLEAYAKLNREQKEAVDTLEGPVMVIAGPGTGKTQILTLRIANILRKTDAKPENILALTFTESGARAMRERLFSYIGESAYLVPIHTFHEFAGTLIRSYPDAYDRVIGGRPIHDIEKIDAIETILGGSGFVHLRPIGDPSFYIGHILTAISTMKRENIRENTFAEIIHREEVELAKIPKIHEKGAHKGKVRSEYQKKEKSILKNKELLRVYREYEALLQSKRLYDFDDMIFETVRALEQNEDMLRDVEEQYQYVLADEHQDVNGSQNRILELISSYHASPNLFVVGDEKQAIYRFQGASLENFLFFEEKYSGTKTIALIESYRSFQRILDVAHELITVEGGPSEALRVPLVAVRSGEAMTELRHFSHQAVEDDFVVKKIVELTKTGILKSEVAVIVRTNREVEAFAEAFRKAGVAIQASADSDILKHPITQTIKILIDALLYPENEEMLFRALHANCWHIAPPDLVKIASSRSYDHSLSSILNDSDFLLSLELQSGGNASRVMEVLQNVRKKESTLAPHEVLEVLLQESGLLDEVMKAEPLEGAQVLRRLFDEIEEMVQSGEAVTLHDVREMFRVRSAHNLPLTAPYIHTAKEAVQVMTAHKAKGLEFSHVFIPHLHDSLWGGRVKPRYFDIPLTQNLYGDAFDGLDDERRLLYVALTRAKDALYISYADTSADGKECVPSRLLSAVEDVHCTPIDTTKDEETFNPLTKLSVQRKNTAVDTTLFATILSERGLSATALNNYLRSPWDYLYRNVLRIPEVQSESALFGTALHDTLRNITAYHSAHGELPTTTMQKTLFERELGKMPLTKEGYVRLHERGFAALLAYVTHMEPNLPKVTKEELKIRVQFETGVEELPMITLTGMLDRLDFDETGKVTQVVDYKSGKVRTRGQIEGKTKDSNGDYKRQLVFYMLLLSLYDDERYKTRNGVLSFIEADSKGVIHEEEYTITDEEVDELRMQIQTVVREIVHGEFLKTPCDPEVSSYCDLADSLFKE